MRVFALEGVGGEFFGGWGLGLEVCGGEVGGWLGAEDFRRVGLWVGGDGLGRGYQRIFLKAASELVEGLELFLGLLGLVQRFLGFFEGVKNF